MQSIKNARGKFLPRIPHAPRRFSLNEAVALPVLDEVNDCGVNEFTLMSVMRANHARSICGGRRLSCIVFQTHSDDVRLFLLLLFEALVNFVRTFHRLENWNIKSFHYFTGV